MRRLAALLALAAAALPLAPVSAAPPPPALRRSLVLTGAPGAEALVRLTAPLRVAHGVPTGSIEGDDAWGYALLPAAGGPAGLFGLRVPHWGALNPIWTADVLPPGTYRLVLLGTKPGATVRVTFPGAPAGTTRVTASRPASARIVQPPSALPAPGTVYSASDTYAPSGAGAYLFAATWYTGTAETVDEQSYCRYEAAPPLDRHTPACAGGTRVAVISLKSQHPSGNAWYAWERVTGRTTYGLDVAVAGQTTEMGSVFVWLPY